MEREVWNSKIGFLLAATGSAMGLGNIWRFPYITGANGGAAFVLVYFIIIFFIGVPVMLAEFAVGRSSKLNTVGAFKKLKGGKWPLVGWIGIVAGFIILSYYSVIAGWTIKYFISSFTGLISPNVDTTTYFNQFISNGLQNIFFQAIFILVTIYVVYLGVEKGIETWSKILMPILILILMLLVIRGVSLPGAPDGIRFYLNPNFSEVTGGTILAALGQAFFSLSLGMGAMITYGSYIPKEISLPKSAFIITFLDMLLALLAGFVIFPTAFTFGIEPGAGTGLIFITLPSIFALMPLGYIWSALFFLLLFIAALTSAIGLLEVSVAYVKDERKWSRKKAALVLGTMAFILGIPSALSNGAISLNLFEMSFLDAMDYLSSNILLPLGGIFVTLFVGWIIKDTALKEINIEGKFKLEKHWIWICRTIAPISIFLIFLAGIGIL
ncbi:MAG: sodium-dependent transporter [Candidatus Methanofastidiosa archaeon]|jgi:NSS family neurotransmitter:Na+ symporter|nr:sodium-dependent transporter [Candidatus Methanofastidiosa archaeon]HOM95504.1 sodium-dependent transporter [Methanofastidiosum sp.]HPC80671.1 sodium-dependent transporter [Methanofastidiosum sp.]HRS25376.1 sodium-dependent transporter [Methanofastidiosum sp.]